MAGVAGERAAAAEALRDAALQEARTEHAGSGVGERVHAEADRLLTEALERARVLLGEHRPLFDAVIADLLADETIDIDRLRQLRAGAEEVPVG